MRGHIGDQSRPLAEARDSRLLLSSRWLTLGWFPDRPGTTFSVCVDPKSIRSFGIREHLRLKLKFVAFQSQQNFRRYRFD